MSCLQFSPHRTVSSELSCAVASALSTVINAQSAEKCPEKPSILACSSDVVSQRWNCLCPSLLSPCSEMCRANIGNSANWRVTINAVDFNNSCKVELTFGPRIGENCICSTSINFHEILLIYHEKVTLLKLQNYFRKHSDLSRSIVSVRPNFDFKVFSHSLGRFRC